MNCLKCPNYWRTDIDETMCDKCGTQTAESEDKENEWMWNLQLWLLLAGRGGGIPSLPLRRLRQSTLRGGWLELKIKKSCANCSHVGAETTSDVACCNCCEDMEFYDELPADLCIEFEEWKFLEFFFEIILDKCGNLWYNKGGVQRAVDSSPGPIFRSDTPIWNFFAQSSGLHMAPILP